MESLGIMKPKLSTLTSRLQQLAVFREVPCAQVRWLAVNARQFTLKQGDYLFRRGDPVEEMILVLQGKIAYMLREDGEQQILNEVKSGEITGALPYSRATAAIAPVQAEQDTELLALPKSYFREMIREHHELTEVLVHIMTSRVREFTRSQEKSEKMQALGKLAAGLTHELNNPAAAVLRSSSSLKEQFNALLRLLQRLVAHSPAQSLLKQLDTLSKSPQRKTAPEAGLLERTAMEDELADWLKKKGIESPYELAENLSEQQLRPGDLEPLTQKTKGEQLKAALECLNLLLNIHKITDDIRLSSGRISELVSAVKAYTHMDKSPEKETVNLHKGIENTLTILNFKLRKKNIKLQTFFQQDLAEVCVYSGELNQLWTNLIDNAIDAMEKGGNLRISTSQESDFVKVDIEDNGPGIPEEIRQQIFEPFFTTKEPGQGTGMGLDIVKRIVDHHQGKIELKKEGDYTRFSIYLPL